MAELRVRNALRVRNSEFGIPKCFSNVLRGSQASLGTALRNSELRILNSEGIPHSAFSVSEFPIPQLQIAPAYRIAMTSSSTIAKIRSSGAR